MELSEILKQFKKIQPDAAFTEKSKRLVLAHTPKPAFSLRRIILGIVETGIAVGLAGFLVMVLTGTFSGTNYIAPVQFSVINPETLHAEAQAVDIQIQLANLSYQVARANGTATGSVSTPQIAAAIIARKPALIVADASSTATSTSPTATSTPSSTISVDQALDELSN